MFITKIIRELNATPPDEWVREDLLREANFVRIGSGCFKTVYGHPDHKFVVKLHGPGSGAGEVENYATAPANLKPYLLRVLQGRGFQIQKRVELRECPESCCGEIDGMLDSWSSSEKRNHTHDLDGNLVIMDYGQSGQWDPDFVAQPVYTLNPSDEEHHS